MLYEETTDEIPYFYLLLQPKRLRFLPSQFVLFVFSVCLSVSTITPIGTEPNCTKLGGGMGNGPLNNPWNFSVDVVRDRPMNFIITFLNFTRYVMLYSLIKQSSNLISM